MGRIEESLEREGCRRCGVSLAAGDDRHRCTVTLRQAGVVRWVRLQLCGACAEDFESPAAAERYLERLLLA